MSHIPSRDNQAEASIEVLDPDVRFLLANERTLLAWVRTALALVAGGLAVSQLGRRTPTTVGLGVLAILLGAAMACMGYARFRAADRAIRSARLPDMGRGPAIQVIGVIGFAAVIVVIELLRTW